MFETLERTLSVLAVLALLGSVVIATTAGAPAVPSETGVYEEDFSTYAYKGYVESAEWDIWAQAMRLARPDAVSQESPASGTDRSGNTVVVWWDSRNGNGDIYAQRLDADGNRLWVTDMRVNSNSGTASDGGFAGTAVAVDKSGNAIVVWVDSRDVAGGIYAQKLDTSGNRMWAADVRVNSYTGAGHWAPAVAVDEDGNAIFVWEDLRNHGRNIYAQRLNKNGAKLWLDDVQVSSSSGAERYDPAVAMDESGNAFIVWESSGNIWAQKLDGLGTRLWAVDVRVNSGSEGSRHGPAVAVDRSGRAIIVWNDEHGGNWDIYAQRVDANGSRMWVADVRVNSDGGTAVQYVPAVAAEENGDAVLVWLDYRNDNDAAIYAQKLDRSGNRLWAGDARVTSDNRAANLYNPTVAIDEDGRVVVVWKRDCQGNDNVYAQRLDRNGNRLWAADVRINFDGGTAGQGQPSVAVDGSGNAVAVWSDTRHGNLGIYAQKLGESGGRLWADDVRVYMGVDSYDVTAGGGGNVVVVWSSAGGIYANRLDGSGNKLWVSDIRVNPDRGSGWSPTAAVDGSGDTIVVWKDWRNDSSDIYAQKLDGSGNRLWAADVRVNTLRVTSEPWFPVVVSDGGGHATVVWEEWRDNDGDIYAQKLDAGGNRLWAADVRVNFDVGTASEPDVAVDSSGSVIVVWEGYHNGSRDIYAQNLDRDGERVWGIDARVNFYEEASQHSPSVAIDGSGSSIVVWHDFRDGNTDVYAQKLDGSGNRLWAADVRVNSDSGMMAQDYPALAMDGSGNAVVMWQDCRNGNADIYAQRISTVGGRGWPADLQVVYPDLFYLPAGIVQSRSVDTRASNIAQANLTANYQTNGGGVQFYLTNDGGAHWSPITPGVKHIFSTIGSNLRWRAVLTADPVWLRTPIVNSLRIEYSAQAPDADDYEPDGTCAQASPLQVNGAVQEHDFHQPDDEDWAWFGVAAGTTYVLQTTQAGSNADTVLELHDVCDHPILTDTNSFGHDARLVFTAPSDGTYYARVTNQDGDVYGEGTDYGLAVRTYHPNGLAVVVAGHNDAWQLQSNIDYAADQAYLTLLEAGFPKANVRYLGPTPNRDVDGNHQNDDIAATATITNVRYAIQDWPREQGLALGVPFYVYLMDHGHYDQFLANGSAQKVTAALLDLWLSNLEATTGADQITVVIDACRSGSFIDVTGAGPAEISGHNRVIVASTTSQANAYPSERGALFSDVLWTALGDNQDVWSAYQAAKAAVDARGLMQTPWLDDNGDALADARDGALARGRGLAGVLGGSEPVIDWLAVGQVSESGAATVRAQVRDDFSVEEVYVEVYPPGYEEPVARPGETPELGVPTTTLALAGGNLYAATLMGLSAPGAYRVVGYAVDDEGNWAQPVAATTCSGKAVYLPLVMRGH